MFSTGFHPHVLQNLIRNWKYLLPELSVRISGMWRWKKCGDDQVCLCNSLAIRQLSKKAVTVVHFEILADVPNKTWPSHVNRLCGKTVLSLDGSHRGVLYDEYLWVTGCDIYAKSMLHQCDNYVTSMLHPYSIWEEWHLCDVDMTPMWHKYSFPQWTVQLRRTSFLFVISTITMLFICTSYTVNFISFKQIYFINICLSTCFHFNDICAINICFSAFVWPLPSRRANILHCWQTWCQNANSAPSKEIYQISGLHTRYRFSLEGSASKKPEAGTRTRPGSYFFG